MSNCTNGGCDCTPNTAIHCTVTSCLNHCRNEQYCGLSSIRIGTHEKSPQMDQCTDCLSFKKQ